MRGFEFVGLDNFATFFTDRRRSAVRLGSASRSRSLATLGRSCCGYLLALLYVFVLRKGSALRPHHRVLPGRPADRRRRAARSAASSPVGDNQGPVNDLLNFFGGESVDWFASTSGTMVSPS